MRIQYGDTLGTLQYTGIEQMKTVTEIMMMHQNDAFWLSVALYPSITCVSLGTNKESIILYLPYIKVNSQNINFTIWRSKLFQKEKKEDQIRPKQ